MKAYDVISISHDGIELERFHSLKYAIKYLELKSENPDVLYIKLEVHIVKKGAQ